MKAIAYASIYQSIDRVDYAECIGLITLADISAYWCCSLCLNVRRMPEPFNECYVDASDSILGGRGIIYTCDLSTGELLLSVYNDPDCSELFASEGGVDVCVWLEEYDDDGHECLDEDACSITGVCTEDGKFVLFKLDCLIAGFALGYCAERASTITNIPWVVSTMHRLQQRFWRGCGGW